MLLHLLKWKAGNSVAKQFSRFHSRLPVTLRKGGFLYDGKLVNISFSSEAHSPAPLYRSFKSSSVQQLMASSGSPSQFNVGVMRKSTPPGSVRITPFLNASS